MKEKSIEELIEEAHKADQDCKRVFERSELDIAIDRINFLSKEMFKKDGRLKCQITKQ